MSQMTSHSAQITIQQRREAEEARRRGRGTTLLSSRADTRAEAAVEHLGTVGLSQAPTLLQNADGTFVSLPGYDS
jgi:hypothetical protein